MLPECSRYRAKDGGPWTNRFSIFCFCVQPRDDNLFLLCSHNRRSPVFDHPTSFPLVTPYDSSTKGSRDTTHGRAQAGRVRRRVVGGAHQTRSPKRQNSHSPKNPEILLSFPLHHFPSDGRESSITQKNQSTLVAARFFARSSLVHFASEHGKEFVLLSGLFALLFLLGVLAVPPLILSPSVSIMWTEQSATRHAPFLHIFIVIALSTFAYRCLPFRAAIVERGTRTDKEKKL